MLRNTLAGSKTVVSMSRNPTVGEKCPCVEHVGAGQRVTRMHHVEEVSILLGFRGFRDTAPGVMSNWLTRLTTIFAVNHEEIAKCYKRRGRGRGRERWRGRGRKEAWKGEEERRTAVIERR